MIMTRAKKINNSGYWKGCALVMDVARIKIISSLDI